MQTRPITVAETQMFERAASKIWNEDERAALIDYMARNPESGDVIPRHGRSAEAALGTVWQW